jgi:hypothetical protein
MRKLILTPERRGNLNYCGKMRKHKERRLKEEVILIIFGKNKKAQRETSERGGN